jgi:hypothetical protein
MPVTIKKYMSETDQTAKVTEMLIYIIEGALAKAGDANISITITNGFAKKLLEELKGETE